VGGGGVFVRPGGVGTPSSRSRLIQRASISIRGRLKRGEPGDIHAIFHPRRSLGARGVEWPIDRRKARRRKPRRVVDAEADISTMSKLRPVRRLVEKGGPTGSA